MMEKNVDLEATTDYERRPIHYACLKGFVEMVKLLMEKI